MISVHSALAIAVLFGFGLLRQPMERSIEQDLRAQGFRVGMALPDQATREQLGQAGVAAMLGGFRSFLATAFELRAVTAWYDADYDSVELFYGIATQLQPREAGYWEMAAWMMESNAASHYKQEVPGESRLERRHRLEKANLAQARGKKFFQDGLSFNPDDYVLNRAFGIYFDRREEDFCQAAEYFKRAAATQDGPSGAKRQAAYFESMCPGKELEAYQQLLDIREELLQRLGYLPPSFVVHCLYLEDLLKIPQAERLPINFDLAAFYARLRQTYQPGSSDRKRFRILVQRLENLLKIPANSRIQR